MTKSKKPWEKDKVVATDTPKSKQDSGGNQWDKDFKLKQDASIGEYARGFSGGVNVGLTGMVGAPVDITNMLLQSVGLGSDEPVGGSKWIKRQVGKAKDVTGDMYPKGPDTTGGRIVHRMGEELGATAIPAAGMLKAARGVVAPTAAGTRGVIREKILDPISRAPGKATVGEVAAAGGAGAGAGVATEMFPGNTTAETWGQLGGGVAPGIAQAISPAGLTVRATKAVTSRFSTKNQVDAAKRAVDKVLGGAMTDTAKKNIAKADKISKEVPGFDPSLAEASGSPPLRVQQSKIEAEATVKFLDEVVDRRVANEKAIADFSKSSAPDGDISPSIVLDSATNRIKVVGETVDRLVGKNLQKQKDLAQNIPTIDKMQVGKKIRDGVQAAKVDASAKMSIRAEELGINEADLSAPFSDWQKKLSGIFKKKSRFEDTKNNPEILKVILGEKAPKASKKPAGFVGGKTPVKKEVQTTFKDIKAIRERISDELILAQSPGKKDRVKIRKLMILRKEVDGFIDSLSSSLGENYATFRKEYFSNYVEPFESGAIFTSRRRDGTGFHKTLDENVADLFLDNQAAAKQFHSIFSQDPEMMAALEGAALDSINKIATKDGVLDTGRLAAWKKKHSAALKELPELNKAVNDIAETQGALIDRQMQLAGRRNSIENTALAKKLSSYSKLNITADKLLTEAVNDPRRMAELVKFVRRDEAAMGALKRTMWDNVISGNSQEVLIALDKNKASLKMLFGKQHFDDIEKISSMKAMMERVPPPKGSATKVEPLKGFEDVTGMAVPQAATRYWAFMSGRVPKYYLAFDVAKQALYKKSQRHFDELLRSALYDRNVARSMAETISSGKFSTKTAKRLGARLAALGIPYIEESAQPENGVDFAGVQQ